MSTQAPKSISADVPKSARIAIAAARFNAEIVDELLAGCLRRLGELGVGEDRVDVVRVPGAFELPVTAGAFARGGRHAAVICLWMSANCGKGAPGSVGSSTRAGAHPMTKTPNTQLPTPNKRVRERVWELDVGSW